MLLYPNLFYRCLRSLQLHFWCRAGLVCPRFLRGQGDVLGEIPLEDEQVDRSGDRGPTINIASLSAWDRSGLLSQRRRNARIPLDMYPGNREEVDQGEVVSTPKSIPRAQSTPLPPANPASSGD